MIEMSVRDVDGLYGPSALAFHRLESMGRYVVDCEVSVDPYRGQRSKTRRPGDGTCERMADERPGKSKESKHVKILLLVARTSGVGGMGRVVIAYD
jgi:hypothetical protein